MRSKVFLKTYIALFAVIILATVFLCACGPKEVEDPMAEVKSYTDLNDPKYRIGVVSGMIEGEIIEEVLPKAQLSYYNSDVDIFTALETGKIDATAGDDMALIYHNIQTGGKLRLLDGFLKPFEFGFIFSKDDNGNKLAAEMSDFITGLEADGTLDQIKHNWMDEDGAKEMGVDYRNLPAPNGVLRLATTGTEPPFTYHDNNLVIGLDIDVVSRFCEAAGYGLEVTTMSFDGMIPSVSTGKCDLGCGALTITEERKQSVTFSAPYYHGGTVAAVFNPNYAADKGFIDGLNDSLRKTFVTQDRYILFIKGILTTLLITLLSALFGTIIGFLVYMACRGGNKVANAVTRVSVRIIQLLPVVVLLMIFYYIVFSSAPVSGTFVSIVAFSLTFGASVYGMLSSSVAAVDIGQEEAAYALGYGNLKTFFKIILPQAMTYFLPSFQSELVSLIKATAVVGYIAVQDLTRMGDIVRSRTYEAFFPIISVAVIYFIMAWFLIIILDRVVISTDPKRRDSTKILKGIKTD